MGFDPDIPADSPAEIRAFEDLAEMDTYSEELQSLLQLLGEQLQVPNLAEHNGDFAAVVPSYDSKSDVPDTELASQLDSNEDGLVLVNGQLYRVTEA